jgi:hypothetical protein
MSDILKIYARHTPTEKAEQELAKLQVAFSDLHRLIEQVAPASRERSVALTNLETAAAWANWSIMYNDPLSKVED